MLSTKVSVIQTIHRNVFQIALRNCSSHNNDFKHKANPEQLHHIYTQLSDTITQHPEDSTVRVRWRVVGIPGFRVIFMFWNFKLWNLKNATNQKSDWTDGFSVFYVANDGLIYKHVIEKITPDEQRTQVKANNSNIGVKLALLLGLTPHSAEEEIMNQLFSFISRLTPFIEISSKVS